MHEVCVALSWYFPISQVVHALIALEVAGEYDPAKQFEQALEPTAGAYEPVLQFVQTVWPEAEKVPSGQSEQNPDPSLAENFPAAHVVQEED